MASKAIFTAIAVLGIVAASGVAWWYQNQPVRPAGDAAVVTGSGSGAPTPAGAASGAARPPAVEIGRVKVVRLADDAQAVGSLRSRQSVMLRPEVSGRVTQINFRDGQKVQRGQMMVQLDDQLPLAQQQQALAELSIAEANHKRNQELVAQNFISRRSLDESSANLQVAQAKLALARAMAARLRIVAPFDGVAGIRSVNIGDYLKDGADIVNIEDLDAIFVDFRLPERFQSKIRPGQRAVVDIDSLPGRRFAAQVQAIDPLVDANGRSIGVRGCIDNRQLQLRPGMFARITAVFGEREDARVIPEEAIVPQGGRQFVIKLEDIAGKETRTARRVEVKVGMRRPGQVEITDGLQAGDVVVTAGQQRVQRDGIEVRVVELGRPATEAGRSPAATSAAKPPGTAAPTDGVQRPSVPASAATAASMATAPRRSASTPSAAAPQRRAAGADPCAVAQSSGPRGASAARPAGS